MKIGFIGLGKMGMNMIMRLLQNGHNIAVYDINENMRKEAVKAGAEEIKELKDFKKKLPERKVVWVMVPAGKVTEKIILELSEILSENDIIIDGGNSFYKDSIKNSLILEKKNIFFLDCGTSGGVWGLEKGYCLMVGGNKNAYEYILPIIKSLSMENGYEYIGDSGSGHFVKMVHNGIEYALMQSYAEGFEILKSKKEYKLDLKKISKLWNNGSVVRSWLLELMENAFEKDPDLSEIKGYVEDSGEGRWTVMAAIEEDVPAPVITQSLFERFRSRQDDSFANKILAALRNEFGGHKVKKSKS